MRKSWISILMVLATLCLTTRLHAQETDTEFQLRLAQSLEQAGEWNRAAALYEKLYSAEPGNEVFFEGLRRAYLRLRAYDKAISLVERHLQSQPMNVALLASLGGIYYEAGLAQKADSVWDRIVEINPKNPGVYRVVAAEMLEHRLFPEAINTYLAGRKATGNDNAFADDLANLYTALQEYDAASKEFIKLVITYPQQLPFIENRIASFTMRDAGLRAAASATREAFNEAPRNVALRRLSAWLAMESKDYQTALEEYKVIDQLSNSRGAELLEFARRASQEGSHLVAAQAFQDVIGQSQNPALVSQARFGYAREMEDISSGGDTSPVQSDVTSPRRISETEKGYQNVIRLYEAVIQDFPNTEFAAQSYYRIGIIRMERFADFNGALDAFRKTKSTTRAINLIGDASRKTAEVYVLQNDLSAARSEYERMLRIPLPADQQMAQFRIAELDYFEGKFDSCLTELKPIVTNLGSDLSNDGLLLQYFITENKGLFPAALKEYAKADLLMRQQRYSESLAAFQEVIHNFPTALLVDDATFKIAELQLKLNQVTEGLATFQHIINDMPESILRDRAQMQIAETYQDVLKDKEKAMAAYEQILAKFPNSLYVEQARKRIRQLRGDAS